MKPELTTDWEPKSIEDADRLYDVAHARSGDKIDTSNIVVIPFDDAIYDDLVEILTAERVDKHYGELVEGGVDRYCLPKTSCMNFVLHGALGGGVSRSIRYDSYGKSMGHYMERFPLDDV